MDQNDMFGEVLLNRPGSGNKNGQILIVRDRDFGYDHPAPAFFSLRACPGLPTYRHGLIFGVLMGHTITVITDSAFTTLKLYFRFHFHHGQPDPSMKLAMASFRVLEKVW